MSNAQESIVKDLEARDAELQSAIADRVRKGGDSTKLRAELKAAQAKLQSARADVASTQDACRQAAGQRSQKLGEVLVSDAIDRITGATAQFSELLSGVSIPDFSVHAALSPAMQNVAVARQRVIDTEAEHAIVQRAVDELVGKAAALRERHAELLRQRATGEAGEGSAAELYATAEDIRTLDEIHGAAKSKADSLLQPVHDARISLKSIEAQAEKVEHRVTAEHLADHVKALDVAYIACLRATQAEGAKAGIGIGALVSTSLALRTFVSTGQLMAQFGRAR